MIRLPLLARAMIAVVGGLLACVGLARPTYATDATDPCWVPPDFTTMTHPLPRVADRIATRTPLRIVAIGSSSTAGTGASAPSQSYPSRLAAELSARIPTIPIEVLNKGVGGERANQMVARFDRDVVAEQPDLVVWQVGTNSLINDEAFDGYLNSISRGLARLKGLGIDVVVMNPQFAPRVTARPNHLEAVAEIGRIAEDEGVWVFPRFEIMRHWVASGRHRLEALLVPDQLHLNDLSYRCIAQLLTDAIESAISQSAATQTVRSPAAKP